MRLVGQRSSQHIFKSLNLPGDMGAGNGTRMPVGKSFIITLSTGIVFGFGFACLILQTNYSPVELKPPEILISLRQVCFAVLCVYE